MSSLDSLYHQVKKIVEQVGPSHSDVTPCLVPPPDMQWFNEREQAQLRELERKIVPFIPVGPGSTIQEFGGPHLALFAICMPVTMAFERMGILDEVWEALTSHECWILPRWWHVYKDLIVPGSPEMVAHCRRHILDTRERLIERFLDIDFASVPKEAFYPFNAYGYKPLQEQIEARRWVGFDWHRLEQWVDYAEEHQLSCGM